MASANSQANAGEDVAAILSPLSRFKKLGLKVQITTVAALGILGLLAYILLSQIGSMESETHRRIANEALDEHEQIAAFHADLQRLRLVERNFFLFRKEADWQKHKELAAKLSQGIAAFGKRVEASQQSGLLPEESDKPVLLLNAIDLNARLDSYALQFVSVASQYNNIGLDDRYGLKKLLRDDKMALNAQLKTLLDPVLGHLHFEMLIVEQDLIRQIGEPMDDRDFKREISQISDALMARIGKSSLSSAKRAEAVEALQTYIKHFGWLADRAKVLAPEAHKLETMAASLETEFDNILGRVEANYVSAMESERRNQARTGKTLRIALIAIVLLVGGASYLAGRSLTELIVGFERSMERLAVGDRNVAISGLRRKDAIGHMARALEVFRKQLSDAERQEAEQAAFRKRVEEEQAAIFESSTFGIAFIKDREMIRSNYKLEELLGYEQGELRGVSTRCWYPDEESWNSVGESYEELRQGKTHRRILRLRRKDGTLIWAKLNGSAISSDLVQGSVWTVEDVTAEHEASEEIVRAKNGAEEAERRLRVSVAQLETANKRLQELDKLKSDFLSSVSHELRTPLTSIRGFAHLIAKDFSRSFAPLSDKDPSLRKKSQRIGDNLEIILKETERLTRLINDVLDLAKIEAGRVDWNDGLVNVGQLVRDSINAVEGIFSLKPSVVLRHHVAQGVPNVLGDADRLQQVLVNLLNNAVKFTEQGEVVVTVYKNDENMVQVDVEDTGIGFSQDEADSIFDKFQQSKMRDTLTDKPQGTGLGLAITREIVTRHGGRIWARSEPGAGSVFSLTLPAEAV